MILYVLKNKDGYLGLRNNRTIIVKDKNKARIFTLDEARLCVQSFYTDCTMEEAAIYDILNDVIKYK